MNSSFSVCKCGVSFVGDTSQLRCLHRHQYLYAARRLACASISKSNVWPKWNTLICFRMKARIITIIIRIECKCKTQMALSAVKIDDISISAASHLTNAFILVFHFVIFTAIFSKNHVQWRRLLHAINSHLVRRKKVRDRCSFWFGWTTGDVMLFANSVQWFFVLMTTTPNDMVRLSSLRIDILLCTRATFWCTI